MAGLEPCPNPWIKCVGGQKPVCTHKDFDGNSELYHVVCHNCGLHGPVMSSKDKAIEAWNRRTPAHSDDAIERDIYDAAWVAFRDSDKPAPYNQVKDAVDAAITAERERYAGIVEALEQRNTELTDALERILSGDIPIEIGERWRHDGKPCKHDRCVHGRVQYEDCGNCIDDFVRATLSKQSDNEGDV